MVKTGIVGVKNGQRHFVADPVSFIGTEDNSSWRGYRQVAGAMAALVVAGALQVMGQEVVRLPVLSATASADDGNVPANTLDGSLSTRWSAQSDGQWIRFDLGVAAAVDSVKIAWYKGNLRSSRFEVQTSDTGSSWTPVFSGQSSGTATALESYNVTDSVGRYVRIVGHGNSVDLWNSITEVEIDGLATSGSTSGPRLNISQTSVSPNGRIVKLNWNDTPGAIVQVQVSSNFVNWVNTGSAITNTGTAQTWQENLSTLALSAWPKRFYRVKHVALAAPVANFALSSFTGVAPLAVTFTDQSTGNPVAWNWTFGDGAGSTAQNPAYTYSLPGNYQATLTVRNSAGDTSTKSASIQATSPPTGGNLPSGVLDLTNWKLTLPIDTSHAGSPDEIKQPELATFQDSNYFYVNSTRDGVVFKAHCGGYTTSGSGYPRSELREMTSNGSANVSWSTTSGTHTMEIRQAITHLPVVKPHVVAGQIHNAADDVIVFRLEGTKLFIDQSGVNGPVLTTNYRSGDIFTAKFVVQNGGVQCYYNGQYIYTYPVSTSGCYFKAGCYTQSNTTKGDAATAYGQVVIYSLSVKHQ